MPPARPSPAGLLVFLPFIVGIALLVRALLSFRDISRLSLPDLDLIDDAGSTAWEVGKCARIRIKAFLHKGMGLRSVQIILLVPPTCKLTKSVPLWTMPADDPLTPGYHVLGSRVRDVRTWAPIEWVIDDLQPTVAGRLQLYYAVEGHAYSTALQIIQVDAH
ncbi:MAG: hypothetical protein HYX75_14120 [Acidobacteria bacterium]|nr:hypothetical protein [Acidobacteriota bacterium]